MYYVLFDIALIENYFFLWYNVENYTKGSFMMLETLKTIGSITGVLGFIISVINFAYFFIIRRKNLNIRFGDIGVREYYTPNDLLKVQFSFENKSQLPISITRVQLVINGTYYDCLRLPVIIEEVERKRNNVVYDRDTIKSTSTPLNLPSLGASSGFLSFQVPRGSLSNDETALTFRICTNRGKAIQKTFALHEDLLIH